MRQYLAQKSINPRTLTWILTAIQIILPIGIALVLVLPCIARDDPKYLKSIEWLVLQQLTLEFFLPFIFISIISISPNLLPVLRKNNKLSLQIALVLAGLLSFLSSIIAGLSPLYAYMHAGFFCFGLHGGLAFFLPADWVYYVCVLSIALAIIVSVRVNKELRAA